MATLLGGDRWNDEITPLDDDWYAYKTEQERKEDPLDDDYVPEKYRTNKDGYHITKCEEENDG